MGARGRWPSHLNLIKWWIFAYIGIVGLYLQSTFAHGHAGDPIASKIAKDVPYLSALLLLGFVVLLLIRLVSWMVTRILG